MDAFDNCSGFSRSGGWLYYEHLGANSDISMKILGLRPNFPGRVAFAFDASTWMPRLISF